MIPRRRFSSTHLVVSRAFFSASGGASVGEPPLLPTLDLPRTDTAACCTRVFACGLAGMRVLGEVVAEYPKSVCFLSAFACKSASPIETLGSCPTISVTRVFKLSRWASSCSSGYFSCPVAGSTSRRTASSSSTTGLIAALVDCCPICDFKD
jgi:hypothetical protein